MGFSTNDFYEDFGLGRLENDNEPIEYRLVYFSRSFAEIATQAWLETSANLCLGGDIELRIVSSKIIKGSENPNYFQLICLDPKVDLEKRIDLKRFQTIVKDIGHENQIGFKRFETPEGISAGISTFGARNFYAMKTLNISKNGMLLETSSNCTLPFQIGTLVEIALEKDLSWEISSPITLFGNVRHMRKTGSENSPARIGIDLKSLNNSLIAQWEQVVSAAEKSLYQRYLSMKKTA